MELPAGRRKHVAGDCVGSSSRMEKPSPPTAQPWPDARCGHLAQAQPRGIAVGIQLPGLMERALCRTGHAKGKLALAQLQPEQKVGGVQFKGLLEEFHRHDKLLVKSPNASGKPKRNPVTRRQGERFLEAIIRAGLSACQQNVAARQPDVIHGRPRPRAHAPLPEPPDGSRPLIVYASVWQTPVARNSKTRAISPFLVTLRKPTWVTWENGTITVMLL